MEPQGLQDEATGAETPVIRVILADDHPIVRQGIHDLLKRAPDILVVGEASDGHAVLQLVDELLPDVLLLDMEMPGLTGVEVARHLKAADAKVRVLALSAYDDEQYIFGLLASGAAGYLTKEEAPLTIIEAVRGVARGEEGWFSRRATAKIVRRTQSELQPEEDPLARLTTRERQLLMLVARGHSNEQIATDLNISYQTVKNHLSSIFAKLDVHSRAEASAWVWQQGLMRGTEDEPL